MMGMQQTQAPMMDLLGGGGSSGGMGGLGDLLGGPSPQPVQAMQQPQLPSLYNAFEDATLKIELSFKRANQNEHHIKAFFSNKSMGPISQVSMQVAVQKYMTLNLQGISSADIGPSSSQQVTQDMTLVNSLEG